MTNDFSALDILTTKEVLGGRWDRTI